MTESKLKKRIFIFFSIAKALTVIVIIMGWQIYAFTKAEMLSLITFILPLFTVYTSVMFNEFVKNKYVDAEISDDKKLKSTFRSVVYLVLPTYVVVIVAIIYAKANHTFTFEEMQTALGIWESGFGVYIGRIIFPLFKKGEEKK